jgi:glycosyltransferase involved in cell wall biosynthesis
LKIEVLGNVSYNLLLKYFSLSRIFISFTINDGLPSSLVEAMSLGAFPIHSNLESISEWITDGINGFLVPIHDKNILKKAIIQSLHDDDLVKNAEQINRILVKNSLSAELIRTKTINMYKKIYSHI